MRKEGRRTKGCERKGLRESTGKGAAERGKYKGRTREGRGARRMIGGNGRGTERKREEGREGTRRAESRERG